MALPSSRQVDVAVKLRIGLLGPSRREGGFSLVELLAGILLTGIIVTLGAAALRGYWLRQGLDRAAATITTEMRGAQQKAMAESHPVVYGLRLEPNSSRWSIVQFDPRKASNQCTVVENHDLPAGVRVASADFTSGGAAATACGTTPTAFFFPRGTATAGTVTFRSTHASPTRTIVVHGLTGRAEEPDS
jgi:type II secretion system protein H